MTDDAPEGFAERFTEEEAARLWQRAAQLQADAARLAEAAVDDAADEEAVDEARETGYALTHVRAAAIEAGIGGEYLDAALADLRAERVLSQNRPARAGAHLARRFLGDPPPAVTVRRVIDASPARVLAAMEEIFPEEPYRLSLIDRQGEPLDGGMLVFKIEGASLVATEGFNGQVSAADLREVYASVRPVDDSGVATELTLRGPVTWAYALNAGIGAFLVSMASGAGFGVGWGVGGAIGGAIAAAGLVPLGAVVSAVVAVGGTTLAGGAGLFGFRRLYDYSLGKGRRGLESLLSVVAVRAQGGWGLTPPSE